jgi:hypothetical protein
MITIEVEVLEYDLIDTQFYISLKYIQHNLKANIKLIKLEC